VRIQVILVLTENILLVFYKCGGCDSELIPKSINIETIAELSSVLIKH
jgi:hypothetical protein